MGFLVAKADKLNGSSSSGPFNFNEAYERYFERSEEIAEVRKVKINPDERSDVGDKYRIKFMNKGM